MSELISQSDRCLLVVAAPKEVQAVLSGFGLDDLPTPPIAQPVRLDHRFDLVRSGVGKSSAAAATARALTLNLTLNQTLNQYRSVISIGIAGSLPADHPLPIGQSVVATRSIFSDEGVGTPDAFVPMSELGFAPFPDAQMGIDHDPKLTRILAQLTDSSGIIATVSWCSGDDGCAKGVVNRTGAIAEAMEGAAVAVACQMIDPTIRTGELRVISNTTGHRAKQVWDLGTALANLSALSARLCVLGPEHGTHGP